MEEQYDVIGENTLTGNEWHFDGPMSRADAVATCKNATRLEFDYKVSYFIRRHGVE
jgi:hypothetical protein